MSFDAQSKSVILNVMQLSLDVMVVSVIIVAAMVAAATAAATAAAGAATQSS